MQKHETEHTPVKYADVDKEMIPVITWLNSFESCNTLYCCEGDENASMYSYEAEPEEGDLLTVPYVSFTCWNKQDLQNILMELYGHALVEIEWNEPKHWFEYIARWFSKKSLKEFKQRCLNG